MESCAETKDLKMSRVKMRYEREKKDKKETKVKKTIMKTLVTPYIS